MWLIQMYLRLIWVWTYCSSSLHDHTVVVKAQPPSLKNTFIPAWGVNLFPENIKTLQKAVPLSLPQFLKAPWVAIVTELRGVSPIQCTVPSPCLWGWCSPSCLLSELLGHGDQLQLVPACPQLLNFSSRLTSASQNSTTHPLPLTSPPNSSELGKTVFTLGYFSSSQKYHHFQTRCRN